MKIPEAFNRKNLLWAMLGALALSALAGAAIVVLPGATYSWRLFVMALITAIACAAMIGSGAMLGGGGGGGSEKPNPAGLWALALIVGVYSLGVSAVWAGLFWQRLDDQLAVIALSGLLCGLPLIPALKFRQGSNDDVPLWFMAALCAAGWCCLSTAQFLPYPLDDKLIATGFCLLALGVLAGVCLMGVPTQRASAWRWVGVLAAFTATLMVLYGTWIASSKDRTLVTAAYALAVTFAYMNMVRRVPLVGWTRGVRVIGVVSVAITGVLLTAMGSENRYFWFDDPISRMLTGTLIIAGAATMGLLVLALLNRRVVAKDAPAGTFTHLELVCPRCGRRQTSPLGQSTCQGCRLRFSLKVQLPVCPTCEYDLSDVRGDKCPECGTAISS